MKGFGDLEKHLKKIERTMKKEVDGEVEFSELFNESFMGRYTKFKTMNDFLEKFGIKTEEDLKNADDAEFDKHVSENTVFPTWEKMQEKAVEEYTAKKLKKLF